MTDTPIKCGFKPDKKFNDPDYQCNHLVARDGLCIFHLPKPTEEQKKAMSPIDRACAEVVQKNFQKGFLQILDDMTIKERGYDCRHFCFPTIDLRGRNFAKTLDLTGATFSGTARFVGATFSKRARFARATFSEWAEFGGAIFRGEAEFWDAIFSERVRFVDAHFEKTASFLNATFNGKVNFVKAHFENWARFGNASFNGWARFGNASFVQEADFEKAIFNGEVDFEKATFRKEANYNGIHVSGKIRFAKNDFSSDCGCFFHGLKLDEKASVIFEEVNLSHASFLDTDLKKIRFRDVTWCERGRSRKVLWDEFPRANYTLDYEKVAENYRQLVLIYEAKRDFDMAEDFHIGEMEMRRRKKGEEAIKKGEEAERNGQQRLAKIRRGWGAVREHVNGYAAYRLLSKYGTSYGRGLSILCGWIFLFSGAFLYTGFAPSTPGGTDSIRIIEYNVFPDATHQRVPWGQWICDYGKSIVFTLSILTFQKERFYEPTSTSSRVWLCIAVLVLAGQTALILFAIRRRFKR